MPACILHLVSLSSSVPQSRFLSALSSSSLKPLIIAKVIRWIITPTQLSVPALLHPKSPWDLFIVTEGPSSLPSDLKLMLVGYWSLTAGVPSRLVNNFADRNEKILHPPPTSIPALTGSLEKPRVASSAQGLEFTEDLSQWISSFSKSSGRGAVSMLNLLAFNPGMKDEYLKYGKAFAETIGARRGGNAKIVGNVIDKEQGWDEIAVAHYPSIMHFADMLASDDYQKVNHRHRIPSLKDTCILCTSEIALEEMGIGQRAAKL
jgi:hypothetical protein